MPDVQHASLRPGAQSGIHVVHAWEVASAAARTALTVGTLDVGKVCRQTDDGEGDEPTVGLAERQPTPREPTERHARPQPFGQAPRRRDPQRRDRQRPQVHHQRSEQADEDRLGGGERQPRQRTDVHADPGQQRHQETEAGEIAVAEPRASPQWYCSQYTDQERDPDGGEEPQRTRRERREQQHSRDDGQQRAQRDDTHRPRGDRREGPAGHRAYTTRPRCTLRTSTGSAVPGVRSGSGATRDRGSVDHRCTESFGARTTNSPTSQIA